MDDEILAAANVLIGGGEAVRRASHEDGDYETGESFCASAETMDDPAPTPQSEPLLA
jgi:hypothetical protein